MFKTINNKQNNIHQLNLSFWFLNKYFLINYLNKKKILEKKPLL